MAPYSRRKIGASRRRREDEGEDEGSVGGELDDDSMSDGSVVSQQEEEDVDGEGRDASDDDASLLQADGNNGPVNGRVQGTKDGRSSSPEKRLLASTLSDAETMINGIKLADPTNEVTEQEGESGQTPSGPNPPDSKREALMEKKRREHEEYMKNREENPAFVPTRGGFFLHDKRLTEPETNGYHPFNKPKSRPYGLIVDGNVGKRPPKTDASDGPWRHDLHETVVSEEVPTPQSPVPASTLTAPTSSKVVPTAPRSSPPNRSFSSTVLIGNVPVVVFLPGMLNPIPYNSVPKRQYTRLPQHRPPLRRDKPVRISLPGQPPRYIFPATERSFIFIPRALRPNQQSFRGRRGGFYGSRRPSIYPGGSYPPSVPMSRRSSFGRGPSREGLNSPAGSVLSRQTIGATTENGKPIVRLPPPARPPGAYQLPTSAGLHIPSASMPPPYPQAPNSAFRESRPAPIPMHQPRPQKAVSVADIESPVSFPFNPPQPQQGQPFHQQVPLPVSAPGYADGSYPHSRHTSHPSQASGTPLPHLPERAIHAPPFHPYSYPPPPGYYTAAYPPVLYPATGTEYPPYGPPVGPGAAGPPFVSPGQPPYVIPPPPIPGEQPTQPGTVAHEAGGTVYYYNTTQIYSSPFSLGAPAAAAAPGGVVGMGGMMTPPAYVYHPPNGILYHPVNGDTGWGRP